MTSGTYNNPIRFQSVGEARKRAAQLGAAIVARVGDDLWRVNHKGEATMVGRIIPELPKLSSATPVEPVVFKEASEDAVAEARRKAEEFKAAHRLANYKLRRRKARLAAKVAAVALWLCSAFTAAAADVPTYYLRALAHVESGDDDAAVGPSGERTRYQVLPRVWRQYSKTPIAAASPKHATDIAKRILSDRVDAFQRKHGRAPNDEEVYALWHRPGRVHQLTRIEADRCERFGRVARKFKFYMQGGGK